MAGNLRIKYLTKYGVDNDNNMMVKNKMTMNMPNDLLKFTSVLISLYYVLKMNCFVFISCYY